MASEYCPVLGELNQMPVPVNVFIQQDTTGSFLSPDILQCQQDRLERHFILLENSPEIRWTQLFERGFR